MALTNKVFSSVGLAIHMPVSWFAVCLCVCVYMWVLMSVAQVITAAQRHL